MKQIWRTLSYTFVFSAMVSAQTPAAGAVNRNANNAPIGATGNLVNGEAAKSGLSSAPNYVLGPDDQIVIRAFEAEELSDKPIAIGADGFIGLPMLGRVRAGGLTVMQLEAELSKRLARYINSPQVTVLVADFRSQPVSVMGAVAMTGQVQLKGGKTLTEVIAAAGGLRQDAGWDVVITRDLSQGALPLAGAKTDPSGKFSIATVNLREVMNGKKPGDNILIRPNDVLTVPKAQLVYVLGEVGRPGGFVLDDHESLSSLQCVALAGGLNKTAASKKAKILRLEPGKAERQEIVANLKDIMDGKSPDISLRADDILFVPNNIPKSAALRVAESAVQIGTGLAIYRY
jgi:polysaccharide export outer membrane protein